MRRFQHTAGRRLALSLSLAGAAQLGSCAAEDPHEDRGDILLVWDQGGGAYADWLQEKGGVEELVAWLNQRFKLPDDIRIIHTDTSCRDNNHYYDKWTRQVFMCYGALPEIDAIESEREREARLRSIWQFLVLHELGHALARVYDLNIPAEAEDLADNFAATQLLRYAGSDSTYAAAEYWRDTDPGRFDDVSLADEHSLHRQRFFRIACIAYGSDSSGNAAPANQGILPERQAGRCEEDYRAAVSGWDALLEPWRR